MLNVPISGYIQQNKKVKQELAKTFTFRHQRHNEIHADSATSSYPDRCYIEASQNLISDLVTSCYCLSVRLPVCLPVRPPACLSACPPVCLSATHLATLSASETFDVFMPPFTPLFQIELKSLSTSRMATYSLCSALLLNRVHW